MKKWSVHAFPAAMLIDNYDEEKACVAASTGLETMCKWLNCVAVYHVVVKRCCLKGRAAITRSKNLLRSVNNYSQQRACLRYRKPFLRVVMAS